MIADAINHVLFGWLTIIPWWLYWVLAIAAVGAIYKFAGWPGIIALAAAIGYVLGRRNVTRLPDAVLPPADSAAPPAVNKPLKRRKLRSVEDMLRGTNND